MTPYGQKTQPTTKLFDNQRSEDKGRPEFGRFADAAGLSRGLNTGTHTGAWDLQRSSSGVTDLHIKNETCSERNEEQR